MPPENRIKMESIINRPTDICAAYSHKPTNWLCRQKIESIVSSCRYLCDQKNEIKMESTINRLLLLIYLCQQKKWNKNGTNLLLLQIFQFHVVDNIVWLKKQWNHWAPKRGDWIESTTSYGTTVKLAITLKKLQHQQKISIINTKTMPS